MLSSNCSSGIKWSLAGHADGVEDLGELGFGEEVLFADEVDDAAAGCDGFFGAFSRLWIAADYAQSAQDLGTMDDEVYL